MIGIVLDSFLMLLLVAAIGYGIRLEKKLTALRAGQLAFAGAVTELNQAAGRAENALRALSAAGDEADMLHDRILKARAVKQELDVLIARQSRGLGPASPAVLREAEPVHEPIREPEPVRATPALRNPLIHGLPDDEDRALRMAALAERISGMARPAAAAASREAAPGRDNVSAIMSALTANQAAQQSLNKARRSMDDDLFAA
jgi:hypothetical protein